MLILVLVILGVGMILITSALSVTIATRNRFYDDAQRSQAKLTVTSAAKSIVDAITITQELRDAKIEAWATAGETIYIRSAKTYNFDDTSVNAPNVAPGIANMTEAYTTVKFGKLGTQITMDFETKIDAGIDGGATENLRVVLKEKEVNSSKERFANLVEIGGSSTKNNFNNTYLGAGGGGKESNIAILRGDYLAGMGGNASYSTVVYTNIVSIGAGFQYFSDVLFMGDKAGLDVDGIINGGSAIQPSQGFLLYVGDQGGSVFWKKSGSIYVPTTFTTGSPSGQHYSAADANIIYNSQFKVTAGSWNSFVRMAEASYFVVSGEPATGGADKNSTFYLDPPYSVTWASGHFRNVGSGNSVTISSMTIPDNPTASEFTQIYPSGRSPKQVLDYYNTKELMDSVNSTIPSKDDAIAIFGGFDPGTGSGVVSANSFLNSDKVFTVGSYKVDTSANATLTGEWTLDLAGGPVKLVLYGGGIFNIAKDAKIRIRNGSDNQFAYIFLYEGVDIIIALTNDSGMKSGIISEDHDGYTWGGVGKTPPAGKPYVYIVGYNENTVDVRGQNSYLEGYYGMYGSNGRINYQYQVNMKGRYEAMYLENIATGPKSYDQVSIPFCVAPWESEGSGGNVPLATKYEVDYYEYH